LEVPQRRHVDQGPAPANLDRVGSQLVAIWPFTCKEKISSLNLFFVI
jgi:hypothetical protein